MQHCSIFTPTILALAAALASLTPAAAQAPEIRLAKQ
jgi:hypothetical protein